VGLAGDGGDVFATEELQEVVEPRARSKSGDNGLILMPMVDGPRLGLALVQAGMRRSPRGPLSVMILFELRQ
jgi:hypothetical protein